MAEEEKKVSAGRRLWGLARRQAGKAPGAAGAAEGLGERYGGRSINQAINVVTGRIDPAQIIKWAVVLLIILGIAIFLVNVFRGFAIATDQFGCGITHLLGGSNVCDPNDPNTIITSQYAFWEAEWYMRCLFYLCLAVIIGLLIYQWAGWLMDKLLHADQDAERLKNWVYGSKWFERGSEEGLETKL